MRRIFISIGLLLLAFFATSCKPKNVVQEEPAQAKGITESNTEIDKKQNQELFSDKQIEDTQPATTYYSQESGC